MGKHACPKCRALVEELEERFRQLKVAAFGEKDFLPPQAWGLTPTETIVLQAIVARPMATRVFIYQALATGRHGYEADPKIIDVLISKMRNKLRAFGIAIETRWGVGYWLEESQRQAIKQACEESGAPIIGPPVEDPARPAAVLDVVLGVLHEGPATLRDLASKVNQRRPGTANTSIQGVLNQLLATKAVSADISALSTARRPARIWSLARTDVAELA